MKEELKRLLKKTVSDYLYEWEVRHGDSLIKQSYLWHYTSISGVKGIFTEGCLWFSDAAFLNDSSELSYAVDVAEDVIRRKIKAEARPLVQEYLQAFLAKIKGDREHQQSYGFTNPAFVACFCREDDSLHLWRAYTGNGRGYSIGFFPSEILSQLKPIQVELRIATRLSDKGRREIRSLTKVYSPALREVIYEEKEQTELLKKVVDSFSQILIDNEAEFQSGDMNNLTRGIFIDRLYSVFYQYLCCFKHPTFKEEREWRYIYTPDFSTKAKPKGGLPKKKVNYRESGGYMVPYLKINIAEVSKNNSEGSETKDIPFDAITIGPGLDERLARTSLNSFLNTTGGAGGMIEINYSSVPLRNIC